MDAMRLLSRPPLSSTPYGTSDMSRFLTASSSVSRSRFKSTGVSGMVASAPSRSPFHHDGWK